MIGRVGGPGGKFWGRRLAIEYQMRTNTKQIQATKASQAA